MIKHFQGHLVDEKETPTQRVLSKIEEVFEQRGKTLYDDFSSQEEHARVTAHMALKNGAPEHLVVACFLHDIGHLLLDEHAGRGDFLAHDRVHEEVGARFLNRAFPPEVAEVVRLHVGAKRYLCTVDDEYIAGLSEASQRSLELQGGSLSPDETAHWIAQPFAKEAAQLRKWEDEGKRLWREGTFQDADLPHTGELLQLVRHMLSQAEAQAELHK